MNGNISNPLPLQYAVQVSRTLYSQRLMQRLGYAGLIPFVALSLLFLALDGGGRSQAGTALVAYGAVILSFLGACHWGTVLVGGDGHDRPGRLYYAVTPALVGWLAMLMPIGYGLALVAGGLLLAYQADRRMFIGYPWYCGLRRRLTAVALASVTAPLLVLF